MLLHLPIVIAATLSPMTVSDTVPNFDIVKECRFEGGSTTIFDRCARDETTALAQLRAEWGQFGGADQKTCMGETTIGGFESYVELLICLQMARDVENEDRDARGPQTTEAMRPRAPGVTVGIGHDPVTSEQVPNKDNR